MKRTAGTAPRTPRKLGNELLARRNRRIANQTRKVLGRHYAAKYRVR
ncbi:hypothetical protein SVA_1001 [Sulfurifustis variabilis]|uniref:Uncharacterized protein n=1 Tax=Sulfurifustis variabilis TaxID=1675686 RepID=A0A1B4V254_9GAMM|nr:hypothetical protein [Sulfurifustis variabilis]BAU47580.1 hypothetical protein SVA_1001 [Sulfurifustis variabilis]